MGRVGIVITAIGDAGVGLGVFAVPAAVAYSSYHHARVLGVVRHAGGHVALTFDDCGDPAAWRSILSTLRGRDVRAAFFCIGQQVKAHPTLARRVRSDGDMLSDHGWFAPGSGHAWCSCHRATDSASQSHDPGRDWQPVRVFPPSVWIVFPSRPRDRWAAGVPACGVVERRPARLAAAGRQGDPAAGSGRDPLGVDRAAALSAADGASAAGILSGLHRRHLTPVLLRTLVHIGNPGPGWWPRDSSLDRPTHSDAGFPRFASVDAPIPPPPPRPIVAA